MRQFSAQHIAALSVMATAIALSLWAARRRPGWFRPMSFALACVILAGWIGEYVADAVLGVWSPKYDLPLQLTDAVSLVAILALCTRWALAVELTYFWALTASLQATLTPDLAQSFPSVFYFTYFAYHEGAVVAGLMLVFGMALYPGRGRHGASSQQRSWSPPWPRLAMFLPAGTTCTSARSRNIPLC